MPLRNVPPSRVFTTPSAAATTTTTKQTGNPYPYTYHPPPRVRACSSSPTARSSVQGQPPYKDYWTPDPQQQTYVYAPNNAAVGTLTMPALNPNMDLGAYTRATQMYPPTSESGSAQASPSAAPPVFSYAMSNSYAQPSTASSSAYTHQQPRNNVLCRNRDELPTMLFHRRRRPQWHSPASDRCQWAG